ncbi:hypothetical protein AOXY_G27781 [Acipenser oxyrinchus oxyrinchus]|uniref:Integrase core domain-containing protein n=1 Tax=Acipenser oxyrinchus oxyrinchus TaxID=40147 RepID=A0AAD8CST2_ACIOX|nr:hypothetical protein AOXY_G27781 [Acipenser oxyrinchus oxyrinchus]
MDNALVKIRFYFRLGLSHKHILECLAHLDGIIVSIRTLKRYMKRAKLFRRKNKSDVLEVVLYLMGEIEHSGQLHGYRIMHLKCIQGGFVISQNEVQMLLSIIDREGVALRRRHRLERRIYYNPGPDFLWHVDSYDKLKPYGICNNGAIDGYSRHIVWLEAYTTNSDPSVIANYFMKAVRSRLGCPKRVCADMGTENGHIEIMQRFMRSEHEDEFAQRSFLYGSSNHNQRIEYWWAFLRGQNSQFWMNLFGSLKDDDKFTGNFLDKNLIQFCFLQIIQDDLNRTVHLWNNHRIRPSRNQVSPHGRPVIMYTLPHLHGAQSQLCNVTPEQVGMCLEECTPKGPTPCDAIVFELCCLLMQEHDCSAPTNPSDALVLYDFLRESIYSDLQI